MQTNEDPIKQDAARKYPVMEIFGAVVQGEGAMVGMQTMFVRFGGCDYRCSWCDSMHAVLPEVVKKNRVLMTAEEIVGNLQEINPHCNTVTLSGGNPVMHPIDDLIELLQQQGYFIAVETQGTIYQSWLHDCHLVTLSPKPPSSKMETDLVKLDLFFRNLLTSRLCMKIVVFDDDDYEFAIMLFNKYRDFEVPYWYMQPGTIVMETVLEAEWPETGLEAEWPESYKSPLAIYREGILDRTKYFIEKACTDPRAYGFRVVPQVHALVYGHLQGV